MRIFQKLTNLQTHKKQKNRSGLQCQTPLVKTKCIHLLLNCIVCMSIVIVVNIYVQIFTNEAEHKSSADQSHTDTKLTAEGQVLVYKSKCLFPMFQIQSKYICPIFVVDSQKLLLTKSRFLPNHWNLINSGCRTPIGLSNTLGPSSRQ